jgi:hypothetical protein
MAVQQLSPNEVTRSPGPHGLITHVKSRDKAGRPVDIPVDVWMKDWTKNRALDHRRNGTIDPMSEFECVAGGIDLRTGMLYDGLNGRQGTAIPPSEVHPFVQRRIDEFRNIQRNDGRNPDKTAPGNPHGDHPRRHAEVKVVNEMLRDRDRHDFPARVDHERAMKEFVVETRFPNLRTPAPSCANCNHLLHGAPAV